MVFLMSRHPVVPPELKHSPFTVAEALQNGLTRKQLRGRSWRRISPGLYAWAGVAEAPAVVLAAVGRRLPSGADFRRAPHSPTGPPPGSTGSIFHRAIRSKSRFLTRVACRPGQAYAYADAPSRRRT